MTTQLTGPVLQYIRDGYPEGVPDRETAALYAVLHERIGGERALDVLRRLHTEGLLSDKAARALLPDDVQMRRVAAKLVLGGWPLAGDSEEDDAPPKEGSALARIVNWLREGYPGGVPDHDYVPLLALLERRLTRGEVKKIAKALRRADVSPAGPSDIAAAIAEYTHSDASDNDLRRVRDQLSKKGWPVEFPDPDLP
ncbi:DUF3349 domain-containing protein [Oryzobacter telluris]|uniref:DUF3349 domain-containing protein n=1 Tax=Oryzobacter telluris TaxID=3149179 RepID=UPI00370D463A